MCESKGTESPRIVMFLKNGELRKNSTAGNGVVVDKAQVVTVLDLIIAVFAVFYVFDLAYHSFEESSTDMHYTDKKSKKSHQLAKTLNKTLRK
jgi:hypothetical protein